MNKGVLLFIGLQCLVSLQEILDKGDKYLALVPKDVALDRSLPTVSRAIANKYIRPLEVYLK